MLPMVRSIELAAIMLDDLGGDALRLAVRGKANTTLHKFGCVHSTGTVKVMGSSGVARDGEGVDVSLLGMFALGESVRKRRRWRGDG